MFQKSYNLSIAYLLNSLIQPQTYRLLLHFLHGDHLNDYAVFTYASKKLSSFNTYVFLALSVQSYYILLKQNGSSMTRTLHTHLNLISHTLPYILKEKDLHEPFAFAIVVKLAENDIPAPNYIPYQTSFKPSHSCRGDFYHLYSYTVPSAETSKTILTPSFSFIYYNKLPIRSFPNSTARLERPKRSLFQERDIIVPSTDFPTETHDEDFHYTHLVAGFVKTPKTINIIPSTYIPVSGIFN